MAATGCPDQAELQGFAVGRLAGALFARVAAHVEGCAECEAALHALDSAGDPLLSRLKELHGAECDAAEAVHDELLTTPAAC